VQIVARFRNKSALVIMLIVGCISSEAATFKRLVVFNGPNGATPVETSLVQGLDGNLYGTTLGGGTNSSGTVFKMTPEGTVTVLYSFCSLSNCQDGALPYGGLVLANDGNFYGTTSQGGSTDGFGTVFRITPTGKFTTLHIFDGADGSGPNAPLIQAANGALYGLTAHGGSSNSGTFFRMTLQGSLTSLYDFLGTDLTGPLVQATDGNFYGTDEFAGTYGHGTVFRLTPGGHFSVLHSFDSTDGSAPACGLVQATDGDLYGTTYEGGPSQACPNGCGTVFKITLSGALTTLHYFDGSDGGLPIAAMIQATDGNFYGTTYAGGNKGWGTIFKITPAGRLTKLHNFQGTDGLQPYGPLSQDTNGNFYGTATYGSGTSQGTAFVLSTGLAPFVSLLRERGKVGQTIGILGQGLMGTSSVSFGHATSTFQVKSDTYLTAIVPSGASSDVVTVITPNGTLKSSASFTVLP
jgi:uncharacterized repeat protein (TIGR03803 family)